MIFCPNCNKLNGYKRALGFGTFFAVLLTAGIWLVAVPFYPKRCISCGLAKSDSVPWCHTWRLLAAIGGALVVFALLLVGTRGGRQIAPQVRSAPGNSEAQPAAAVAPTLTASEAADPSVPHDVEVSEPNVTMTESAEHICGFDFKNSHVSQGEDKSAVLTNGRYEKREDLSSESVDLENRYCFHAVDGIERALIVTKWTGCGAHCQQTGVAQVFELRNNHPFITQEIVFDLNAQGAAATFDEDSLKLTIAGRYYDPGDGQCCPKNLEVVGYRWQGHKFVQSSYERRPISAVAAGQRPYESGEDVALEQFSAPFDIAKSECLSLVRFHFPKLDFWPDPALEENSRRQYQENGKRVVVFVGFGAGMPGNGSGDAVCSVQGSTIGLQHVQLGILSYNFDSDGNLVRNGGRASN